MVSYVPMNYISCSHSTYGETRLCGLSKTWPKYRDTARMGVRLPNSCLGHSMAYCFSTPHPPLRDPRDLIGGVGSTWSVYHHVTGRQEGGERCWRTASPDLTLSLSFSDWMSKKEGLIL